MHFPKDSAGRLMVTSVPVVKATALVGEVEDLLRFKAREFQTINYIYITNESGQLDGVLSLRELFSMKREDNLTSFSGRVVHAVRPHTDQERVAQMALKYNIKAVPVISKEHVFLGVVPSDKILSVLNLEHTEDVLRFAGVSHKHAPAADVLVSGSSFRHVRMRLPWLVLGLMGGVLAAIVVGLFEETLADELILAAFIPAVVYMADAVGSQTQMLFVRALSIEQGLRVRSYLWRESVVNFFLGTILAVIIFLVSLLWVESLIISLILATSIFLTVWFTVIVAIALPWFFHTHGQDPAIASGPLATVVRDILSLCIYLFVATLFLM